MDLGTLKKSNECPICSSGMRRMIELPKYPLTEMYEPWAPEFQEGRGVIDQAFLLCERCSHGKLETIVPPRMLYGPDYRTRTTASAGATAAVQRFAGFIRRHADLSAVDTVIDIGGNDGELLRLLKADRRQLVAVDPNASGDGLVLIRSHIEDADLAPFRGAHKLIVSSHTLEHIERPDVFLDKVRATLCHGEYLALQFPALERLALDARIDHIHHQHIHYYSERSISALLAKHGLEIVAAEFDHQHYGALMVLARRGDGTARGASISHVRIQYAKGAFEAHIIALNRITDEKPLVAFGAALMLPILRYYVRTLHQVEYIADNDRAKDGLRYINFNKPIRCDYDLTDRDVVITGVATKAAARALTAQAFAKGARNVILPVQAL